MARYKQKGQPGLPLCVPTTGETAAFPLSGYYLRNCANLLRNFSTRPPSESTDFWVPV